MAGLCRQLVLLYLLRAVSADIAPFYDSEAYAAGLYGNYSRQAYISDLSFEGPVAHIMVPPQEGVSPSRFVGWAPGGPPPLPQTHPMLLDAHNFASVWSGPALHYETIGPTVQTCNNTEYLTWWSGVFVDGHKQGLGYVMNNKYEIVYNVSAQHPLRKADCHELFLTPHCTAVFTAYQVEPWDLSYYNITDGHIIDSHFQEVDLATGELLFTWKASKHMDIIKEIDGRKPIANQGHTPQKAHDWLHINSVEKDYLGNYLVSARHSFTVYYISGTTGDVIWRLGGNYTDYKDMSGGKALDFSWQHQATWVDHEHTRISLYDDRNGGRMSWNAEPVSRGIVLRLDHEKHEVWLEHEYYATNEVASCREGSMQVLKDSPTPGNAMLGYGEDPGWTEYHQNGTVLLDVAFGPLHMNRDSADNYRSLKVNWTAAPHWGPNIAPGPPQSYVFDSTKSLFHIRLQDDGGEPITNDTVYFSWNGATEIRSWALLASNDTPNLTIADHFLAEVPKMGFESHKFVGGAIKYTAALALDVNDQVLGATPVVDMKTQHRHSGPAGPNGDETVELTTAWQEFVATHTASSAFGQLHRQLHKVDRHTFRMSWERKLALFCMGIALVMVCIYSARNSARLYRLFVLRVVRAGYSQLSSDDELGSYHDAEKHGIKIRVRRPSASP